jgi:hypothetical protein
MIRIPGCISVTNSTHISFATPDHIDLHETQPPDDRMTGLKITRPTARPDIVLETSMRGDQRTLEFSPPELTKLTRSDVRRHRRIRNSQPETLEIAILNFDGDTTALSGCLVSFKKL